jgi:acetylglutamate kinase
MIRANTLEEIPQGELDRWAHRFQEVDPHRFAVVKISGSSIDTHLKDITHSVGVLALQRLTPTIIYGWGSSLTRILDERGIPYEWDEKTGDRVTRPEAMPEVERVSELYGRTIVEAFRARGIKAELCDRVIQAQPKNIEGVSYTHCNGEVTGVDIDLLIDLTGEGVVPVVSQIGNYDGRRLNINADSTAREVFTSLKPLKYCQVTNIGGILDRQGHVMPYISLGIDLPKLLGDGTVTEGARKKLLEARELLADSNANGLHHSVQITHPTTLLIELFTDRGCGTYVEP